MSDQPEQLSGIEPANQGNLHSLAARYGRRALLLGAAATGAGLAANLVTGGAAQAAPDASGSVLLGKSNTTHGTTSVSARGGTGLSGHTATHGQAGVSGFDTSATGSFGLYGKSTHGTGVLGSSTHKSGVTGLTFTPGESGVAGIDMCTAKGAHGVYGQTYHGFGVFGIGIKGGTGVGGQSQVAGQSGVAGFDTAPSGGTALLGQSFHGTALRVEGQAKFSTSGVAHVPGGQNTVKVEVRGMTPASKVLATIQKPQSGVFIEGAEPGNGSFTLTLSKNATGSLPVSFFVLE